MTIPPAYSFICTVAHGPAKPGNQLLPGTRGAQGLHLVLHLFTALDTGSQPMKRDLPTYPHFRTSVFSSCLSVHGLKVHVLY